MSELQSSNLNLRRATDLDVDQIDALHGHPAWLRPAFANPNIGPDNFTVVADGDRVVSTLCLLRLRLRVGTVEVHAGSPEWVNTDPAFRNRGLVRAQIEEVHEWSEARGDLLQVIGGIPFFYRQFGYQYGIASPPRRLVLAADLPPEDAGWTVRPAGPSDVDAFIRLRGAASGAAGVARVVDRPTAMEAVTPSAGLAVAERAGIVQAIAYLRPQQAGRPQRVLGPASSSAGALWALLRSASDGHPVEIEATPSIWPVVAPISGPLANPPALYVRISDPPRFLDHLRPELERRLRESPFADDTGSLVISTYRASVELEYDHGNLAPVVKGPGIQDPAAAGGLGIPPDHLCQLLVGRRGITELRKAHDDIEIGSAAPLVDVLFPKLRHDLSQ